MYPAFFSKYLHSWLFNLRANTSLIDNKEKGIVIGVTDYCVSEFGDSDWEWSAHLDKENGDKLIKELRKEFVVETSLKEMIIVKFGNNLSTIDFIKYLDEHNIKYVIERSWWCKKSGQFNNRRKE